MKPVTLILMSDLYNTSVYTLCRLSGSGIWQRRRARRTSKHGRWRPGVPSWRPCRSSPLPNRPWVRSCCSSTQRAEPKSSEVVLRWFDLKQGWGRAGRGHTQASSSTSPRPPCCLLMRYVRTALAACPEAASDTIGSYPGVQQRPATAASWHVVSRSHSATGLPALCRTATLRLWCMLSVWQQ